MPPTAVTLASPGADVSLTLSVLTPLIFNYWIWRKPPGGTWQQLSTAEVPSQASSAEHIYTLSAVVAGTEISVVFTFTGPVGTPVNASATLSQNGQTLAGGTFALTPTATSGNAQAGEVQAVLQ